MKPLSRRAALTPIYAQTHPDKTSPSPDLIYRQGREEIQAITAMQCSHEQQQCVVSEPTTSVLKQIMENPAHE